MSEWISVRDFAEAILAESVEGGYDKHLIVGFEVDANGNLTILQEPPGSSGVLASVGPRTVIGPNRKDPDA